MACKILIVEDDAHIAKYIQTCLAVGNYESEIYSDGLAAVERITRGDCDLILLDIMLPGLNGFEVMERVKEYGIPVPDRTGSQFHFPGAVDQESGGQLVIGEEKG